MTCSAAYAAASHSSPAQACADAWGGTGLPAPLPARLPKHPDKTCKRGKFAETAIGCVHIDISERGLAQGEPSMVLAIDRVSKLTDAEFRDDAGKMNGADFLRGVAQAFAYAIHTVPSENGMAFADLPKNRDGPTRRCLGAHMLGRACAENGIKHRPPSRAAPGATARPSG